MAKPISKKSALDRSKAAPRQSEAVDILKQYQGDAPAAPAPATPPLSSQPVQPATPAAEVGSYTPPAPRKPGPPKGYRSPRQLEPVPVDEWFGDDATKMSVQVNQGLERQLRYVAERNGASIVDTVNLALFHLFRENETRQLELFNEFRMERFERRRANGGQ